MTLQVLATPGEHMQVLLSTVLPTKDFFSTIQNKESGNRRGRKKGKIYLR